MSKLVVLKLGEGSFEQGFSVTLQIGNDGDRPFAETTGRLPPAPEISQFYNGWRVAYRRLGLRSRLEAKAGLVTNVSKIEDCRNAAQQLRDRLNSWLRSESFYPIREKLLEKLNPSDEVRAIVQTEDLQLRRLPWHLWDLCDRYPKAEISLSAPIYERVEQLSPPAEKVRILAILGNSTGIDTQADRLLLQQLPNAEIHFLVEPKREQLNDQLWKQGWDILFFAGHSSSYSNSETGLIYLNQTESLTIDQLKYGLKKAVERGLKIAILNSCDGLGLAKELADLRIAQIILMREPVPDRVAQEFLKYFLEAFARGERFYLSVREARERLQGLEDKFPCATWLPVIYQNPAEMPPTWQSLCGQSENTGELERSIAREVARYISGELQANTLPPRPPIPEDISTPLPVTPKPAETFRCSWRFVLIAGTLVTSILMGVRHLGILQPLELKAFDNLVRIRPQEQPDPRLLVVTVSEADIQAQNPEQRRGSLSDSTLNQLLQKLESFKPRAIGLDIYRDFPVKRDQKDLATRLRKNNRLIAVCQVSNSEEAIPGIPPPPEIPTERLGFSDIVLDSDGIARRHLLAMEPDPASPCTTSYALSVKLAFHYLAPEGIFPKETKDGFLQLGNVIFKPLEAHTGGYQGVDARGHQVLLNYRSLRSPQAIATQVTLADVLKGRINPSSVKNRIILIGTSANSTPDYWLTPYSKDLLPSQQTRGLLLHAQMVSQILSAVLDRRPLLWVWPTWGETLWIWSWSLIGGVLAKRLKSTLHLVSAIAAGQLALYGFCFGFLTFSSCWVPLVPPALALLATGGGVAIYTGFKIRQQQQYISQHSHELEKITVSTGSDRSCDRATPR